MWGCGQPRRQATVSEHTYFLVTTTRRICRVPRAAGGVHRDLALHINNCCSAPPPSKFATPKAAAIFLSRIGSSRRFWERCPEILHTHVFYVPLSTRHRTVCFFYIYFFIFGPKGLPNYRIFGPCGIPHIFPAKKKKLMGQQGLTQHVQNFGICIS